MKENVTTTEGGYPTLTFNVFVIPDEGLAQSAIQKETFDKNVETKMYVNTETNSGSAYFKINPSCYVY